MQSRAQTNRMLVGGRKKSRVAVIVEPNTRAFKQMRSRAGGTKTRERDPNANLRGLLLLSKLGGEAHVQSRSQRSHHARQLF